MRDVLIMTTPLRPFQSVSYRFVGFLYSRRLSLPYSNHVENHLVHMGTWCMHIMMSSISLLVHFFFPRFLFSQKEVCLRKLRKFAPSENVTLYSNSSMPLLAHPCLHNVLISLVILFFSCMCIHNKSSLSHLFSVSSVYQQFHSTIWELRNVPVIQV